MDGFVALAREEERQLEAALSKNLIYIKLEAVRALLRAYDSDNPNSKLDPLVDSESPRTEIRMKMGVGKSISVAGQVRALVIPYLKETGTRVQSSKILDFVQNRGVTLGGQNPLATLSSYLSGTPELDNVRGQGYGLREWSESQTETAPPAPYSEDNQADGETAESEKPNSSAPDEELFG